MFLSLFNFDFASALRHNAAVLCLLPLMAATFARYAYVYVKHGKMKDRAADSAIVVMIVCLVTFCIVRNFAGI